MSTTPCAWSSVRRSTRSAALDQRYWADADGKGRTVTLVDGKERVDTADGKSIPTPPESIVQQESSDGTVTKLPPGGKIERTPVNTEQPRLRDFPTEPKALAAKMRELASRSRLEQGERADDARLRPRRVPDDRRPARHPARGAARRVRLPVRPAGDEARRRRDRPARPPGVAVAADGDPEIHENVGVELIVDPDTGRPLAMVHYRGDVDHPWLQMTRTEGVVKDTTRRLPG